ncbi:CehA/McbA family metallohydrolase [Dactylosporangium sp. CA-092794]|uniref:CehA/McbA family metallohydrolase n=1 Tax=Dactylosporangium sp. CA-092794 TaxID=3239929 RepID=UPI003D8EB453
MTIEEAIAGPAVAGAQTALVFRGRFGPGIDRWAYVPFAVPAGVRRISVWTWHERFSLFRVARNVLDLGIFGPDGHGVGRAPGFRGWSGGARQGFTLSAIDATPGYLAGPIEAGRWALALGPVVLNPLGMRWQARIVLEHGEPGDCLATGPAPAAAAGRGTGWYRGDLHLHTVHSDGRRRPAELVAEARAAGLDFIVSTEHNTNAANRMWAAAQPDDLLVVAGEEVTTRHGHWLAVGLGPGEWVDWRYAPRDRVFGRYAEQVRRGGGLVVVAHPAVPMPGAAWEFGYRDVDAIEVWNGVWNVDDEVSLRIWQRLLRRGRRIVAVGGSDSHAAHQRVGLPQTVVHAAALSTPALVEALRHGRSYIAASSDVTLELTASSTTGEGTRTAGPGDTLAVPPGTPVTVTATVTGAPGTTLAIITAQGCAARAAIGASGAHRVRWTTTADRAGFVRIEVRRPAFGRLSAMVALSNPVWLQPLVPPAI